MKRRTANWPLPFSDASCSATGEDGRRLTVCFDEVQAEPVSLRDVTHGETGFPGKTSPTRFNLPDVRKDHWSSLSFLHILTF